MASNRLSLVALVYTTPNTIDVRTIADVPGLQINGNNYVYQNYQGKIGGETEQQRPNFPGWVIGVYDRDKNSHLTSMANAAKSIVKSRDI